MRKQQGALAPNENDSSPNEILHIKCDVIKFIRDQMNNIEGKGTINPSLESPRSAKTKRSTKRQGASDNWGYIQILALCSLLFILFLYGAIVGANICHSKMHGCQPLFPGLGLGRKSHQIIF